MRRSAGSSLGDQGTSDVKTDDIEAIDSRQNDKSRQTKFGVVGLAVLLLGALYIERQWLYDETEWIRSAVEPPPVPAYDAHLASLKEVRLLSTSGVSDSPSSVRLSHETVQLAPPPSLRGGSIPSSPSSQSIVERRVPAPGATIIGSPIERQKSHSLQPPPPPPPPIKVTAESVKGILEKKVKDLTATVRQLKSQKKYATLGDPEATETTTKLQDACRKLLPLKYGPEPYQLELTLSFPETMPDFATAGADGTVLIEMAPARLMPYSVLTFLDMVVNEWKGGAFHRNAPHVKQVTVAGRHAGFPLAFQEYSPEFPHVRFSLGFAGRPSSSAFYISTVDNTVNHGPGSQGAKATKEADACFARVLQRDEGGGDSVEVVKRMKGQPGAAGANGFVSGKQNYIEIRSFKLLR